MYLPTWWWWSCDDHDGENEEEEDADDIWWYLMIVMMARRETQILITTPDPPTLGQPVAKWHDELRRTPHPTCLEQKYPGCGHKGTIGFGHKDTCKWKTKIVTVRNDWNTCGNVHRRTFSKGYRDWPLEIGYGLAQSTRLGNKTTRNIQPLGTHILSKSDRADVFWCIPRAGAWIEWQMFMVQLLRGKPYPHPWKCPVPLGIIWYFSTWMCTPVIVWWITKVFKASYEILPGMSCHIQITNELTTRPFPRQTLVSYRIYDCHSGPKFSPYWNIQEKDPTIF